MNLDTENIDEIEELAEYISDTYWDNQRISLEKLIKKNDIDLVYDDFEDAFDGVLQYEQGEFTIFCNTAKNDESRRRFTLAHELGHFYIPRHRHALIYGGFEHPCHCDYTSDQKMEREADTFASNILMPKKRFEKAAKKVTRGLDGVRKLATQFGTSLTSTAIRYLDLYLKDGVIIKWNSAGEYSWRRIPSDIGFGFKTVTIKTRSELVPNSATDEFLHGEIDQKHIHSKGTTKSSWFKNIRQGSYNDDIWIENVMRIGQYGYLTLVFPE